MEKEKTSANKNFIIFLNPWISLIICLVLATLFLVVTHFIQQEKKEKSAEFSSVNRICELATLQCYYHNVGERIVEPNPIFEHGLFKYGYKKIWLEYEGVVTVGIDAKDVIIEKPNEDGVVRIYVPEAKVLDVDADLEKMGDPITETGAFTSITTDEQSLLFSEEQNSMKEKVAQDVATLNQARYNAEKVLESYVKYIGKTIGKEYTVEFMESVGTSTNVLSTAEETSS